ncbi:MAG: polyprenol monophosphomannose synthase [Duncaniella sp.]|nr:polyprenol monophosphomannose synthase [Duncaniella sp.]
MESTESKALATAPTEALVIIPTYNEKENVRAITEAVLALPDGFDILIIDDNSPDGTAEIVEEMMKEIPGRIHLLRRAGKLGLGTAYIEGFKWALARENYQYIFEMDADFSHNPADLTRLLKACREDGADVAIGSRYLTGVNVVNWPMGRVMMSYYASKYVRIVTGMPVNDATAGFVCWTRRVLSALPLDHIRFKGYAFQIEMKFLAYKYGFKIVEVPIVFVNRVLGTSKMSSGIFSEGFFGVLRLKWSSLFTKYPDYSK